METHEAIGRRIVLHCRNCYSIPASLKTCVADAFPEEVLANVTFTGEGTKNFYFEENKSGKGYKAIYNADKTELYYINPTAEGTIVIPKEVTSLGDKCFCRT